MATLEEDAKRAKKQRKAEERNPLLKLGLGELVREMQIIAVRNPDVLKPKDKRTPSEGTLADYKKYDDIIEELAGRERGYNSYKPEPRDGYS
jgi:hypothetical protein